ncbi:hypothetical protein OU995_16645 [Roseateles sp. SL47]|uniref:hypothetical protein n=1 Tax=Roseateles sp. SL47 TaxID=2995138 RepID=UPI002271EE11|nr:hypothetical protein [Roseateles sp. SL47]WAC76009.1 hypothetical protein OU995_16645 [Roseateles sp. SL47]
MSIIVSKRARKKSSGAIAVVSKLPGTAPHCNANWEFWISAITRKASVHAGRRGFAGPTKNFITVAYLRMSKLTHLPVIPMARVASH